MDRALSRLVEWRNHFDERLASYRRIPLILFACAFVLKALYVIASNSSLDIRVPIMDAKYYDEMAREIASGGVVRPGAFFMSPLYQYVLGLVYAVVGRDFLVVRLLQAAGGALTVALVYRLGCIVLRPSVALTASVFLMLYGAATFNEGQMLVMWLGTLLNTSVLVVLAGVVQRREAWRLVAAGALLGLAALARANALLFVPVAAAWAAWALPGNSAVRVRNAAVVVLAVAIVILPATVHNYVASRDVVLVTSNGGLNFYIGNSRQATGIFYPPPDVDFVGDTTTRIYIERKMGRDLKPSEISGYWYARAADDMREDPARALRVMLRKVALFVNGYEIPQLDSFAKARADHGILRALFVSFWWLSALGLVGLFVGWRRSRGHALLAAFVLTYAVSIILFFVTARYRVQVAPVLALFAANLLLVEVPRLRHAPRRLAGVGVAVVLAFAATAPGLFEWDARELSFRAHVHNARRHSEIGEKDKALREINRAIGLFPDYFEGYIHRATIHTATRNHFGAMEDYAKAVELRPDLANIHYDLAQTLQRVNLVDEAIEEYRAAVVADPYMIKAYNNLGIALRGQERFDEALASFRAVVELDPAYVRGYNNLGACLAEAGRIQEAIELFHTMLIQFPDYANTYRNLAMAYTSQRQVAPALDAIEKYLEMRPDDTMAIEMREKLLIAQRADSTSVE